MRWMSPPSRVIQLLAMVLLAVSLLHLAGQLSRPSAPPGWGAPLRNGGILPGRGVDRNLALAQLTRVEPPRSPAEAQHEWKYNTVLGGFKWHTESMLRSLTACAVRGDCHPNAYKIAIFATMHCHMALYDGYTGGEGVWCKGMMDSLRRQGYTVILARRDWEYIYHLYRQIPDLIKVIVADPKGEHDIWYTDYIKKKNRPDGIPAWKFFFFYYFPNSFTTIVGNRWTIVAEPTFNGEPCTYLGYGMEPEAMNGAVPFEKRPHRVYLMAKYSWFFNPPMEYKAWEHDFYQKVTDELRQRWPDFEIVGAITEGRFPKQVEEEGEYLIPEGIHNYGKLNATEFDDKISNSRLLLGIGRPGLSPSPYRALARGVPFLNVDMGHNMFQHNSLATLGEPYVYNVKTGNYTGFAEAIAKAMETPVKPWIAPWMEMKAFDKRMRDFIERDWRSEAAEILEQRIAGNETQFQFPNSREAGKLDIFEL